MNILERYHAMDYGAPEARNEADAWLAARDFGRRCSSAATGR
jgi:aldehyde dehydrogenase (NAD+)